jgi:four helix bundle protein
MIALGSANETILWCRFAKDLGYIDLETHHRVDAMYAKIARMLSALAARVAS